MREFNAPRALNECALAALIALLQPAAQADSWTAMANYRPGDETLSFKQEKVS
jgi:hypothetical protein